MGIRPCREKRFGGSWTWGLPDATPPTCQDPRKHETWHLGAIANTKEYADSGPGTVETCQDDLSWHDSEGRSVPQPREWTPEAFATEIVGATPLVKDEVIAQAKARGVRKTEATALLNRAVAAGMVHRHRGGGRTPPADSARTHQMARLSPKGREERSARSPPPVLMHRGVRGDACALPVHNRLH